MHNKPLFLLFLTFISLSLTSQPQSLPKINYVVVLMEENRSFDHMFGWASSILKTDGLTGKEYNQYSTLDPNSKKVYVDDLSPDFSPCDPDHGYAATTHKIFGEKQIKMHNYSVEGMVGFVEWEVGHDLPSTDCGVLSMQSPDKLPVLVSLAKEYAVMDKFFASVPGPTWPNRMYFHAATSAGSTATYPWYRMDMGRLFPQRTFMDQLMAEGFSWKNYYNDTPWELFMEGFAHHPDHQATMDEFFYDCQMGTLPSYSFINPRSGINTTNGQGSNDQHPDHSIVAGELYIKDVYEAVRASPLWNETLLIITYDEHGGFYDHISPPDHNVPGPGDNETSYPDKGVTFDRLGIRVPVVLVSPWIESGTVIGRPPSAQKPYENSEYEHTSVMATVRKLFNMTSGPLTNRDRWAATFEQREANLPLNSLQEDIITMLAELNGLPSSIKAHEHVPVQGLVGDWVNKYHQNYLANALEWKKAKMADPVFPVQVAPCFDLLVPFPHINRGWANVQWNINIDPSLPYATVSSVDIKSPNGHAYCLAVNSQDHSRLTATPCFPDSNPRTNKDDAQKWIYGPQAEFKPWLSQNECLTAFANVGGNETLVVKCTGMVNQHFAWHGPGLLSSTPEIQPQQTSTSGAGETDSLLVFFGDGTNCLGLAKPGTPTSTITIN